MFMCESCNEKDEHCRYRQSEGRGHYYVSHGECEICKKVADCVDCKCYHYFPKREKR